MAEANDTLLIQFARSPAAGQVKTRMMPRLSPEEACALHCDLVLWICENLVDARLGPVWLSVAGPLENPLFERCRALGAIGVTAQRGKDLGERMHRALTTGLEQFEAAILVGSDCPEITPDYMRRARELLCHSDVVLGPAHDGGYVLVGLRQPLPALFEDMPWGTEAVMDATRKRLRILGLSWGELEALSDIDRPEDLALWQALKRGKAVERGRGC